MRIILNFHRQEGESEEELIYRICQQKDIIGSWFDVAAILNELLGYEYTESKYRKQYSAFNKMLQANQAKISNVAEHLEDLQFIRREIEKERKKLQTEKLEYNKWLREEARDEMIAESICNAIEKLEPLQSPVYREPIEDEKSYLLVFGDEHYGTEFKIDDLFGNTLNEYSPEIFEERMKNLFDQVVALIKKENITQLNIFNMGDSTDGLLRVSQLMKLRYGVVDSAINYAYFISDWLNALSEYVVINFQMVAGNHTELRMLGQPKNTFSDDNMDKVIRMFIKERLKNNPNFNFIENPTGSVFANIASHTVMGIHGEVKNMQNALREYSQIYGVRIDYLLAGHLHHLKTEEICGHSEVINVPSIIGVDDYSLKLRKTSNAGAEMFVFTNKDGLICDYRLKLN